MDFLTLIDSISGKLQLLGRNQHEELQLGRMQDDLVFLRSFFQNEGKQHNQHQLVHALRIRVIEVAYRTESVVDSLIAGNESFRCLMLFDQFKQEIELVRNEAQKATKIWTLVTSLERRKWAGASHRVLSQASILAFSQVVVGLKDEAQAMIDNLTRGSMQLDMVSIVGPPGMGKTTLAQKVYNHPSVTHHFHVRAWCCISQTCSKKYLLLDILASIDRKKDAQYFDMSEDDLAEKLYKRLKKRRFLIVLDDVLNIEIVNNLRICFPDDTNGSRILLTSPNRNSTGKCHHLRPLSDDQSWELLQNKLEITREEGCPPELNGLTRQIAKNCNGLPLSIGLVSGILATLDQVGWEEVAEWQFSNNMLGAIEECEVMLELSNMYLPDHLKPCLYYLTVFPANYEIPVRRLLHLWIAEGFVQKNESGSQEEIAEGYLMALINRSLVIVGKQTSTGGIKTCRIHNLVRAFCIENAKKWRFFIYDEPQHLSWLSIDSQPEHFRRLGAFCPRIHSRLHFSPGVGSFEVPFALSFDFDMKHLRVLDLEHFSPGHTLPSELGLLVHLRYLGVVGGIKDIPSSLTNLTNLETFIVKTYYSGISLSLLPDTFRNMQKLRHLHVRGAFVDLNLVNDNCESSSSLYCLVSFSTPVLYLGQSMEKMMRKFPNIRRLKCCLLESEESTGDSNGIVAMEFLSRLESLKLLLGNVTLHHIEFHLPLNLKKLTLEDFPWSIFSTIRKLPNLEVLKLIRRADCKGVGKWEMEEEEFFPKLKFLKLEDLNMVGWRGSGDHFPCLEKLILEGCMKLQELPSCLGECLTLQLIEVHRCPELVGCLVRDIKEEQLNWGNEDLNIIISEEIEDFSSWSD